MPRRGQAKARTGDRLFPSDGYGEVMRQVKPADDWLAGGRGAVRIPATTAITSALAAGQEHLARRFAAPGDRFAGTPLVDELDTGPPELADTAATLVCRRCRVVPAGDHLVLFGEICRHAAGALPPLLFLDGDYRPARPAWQPTSPVSRRAGGVPGRTPDARTGPAVGARPVR